ncbi:MAG: hypothetical protein AAF533_27435, partial [Acidobacteriota bacterium]
MSDQLLDINDLQVFFHTSEGVVRAVDRVSFQGRVLPLGRCMSYVSRVLPLGRCMSYVSRVLPL